MPCFNLSVPKSVPGADSKVLLPINAWSDKDAYKKQATKLAEQFVKNFKKYEDGTPKEVVAKGGPSGTYT
jgi:phosphoenolpyruvate carboxykinase (ATP)